MRIEPARLVLQILTQSTAKRPTAPGPRSQSNTRSGFCRGRREQVALVPAKSQPEMYVNDFGQRIRVRFFANVLVGSAHRQLKISPDRHTPTLKDRRPHLLIFCVELERR